MQRYFKRVLAFLTATIMAMSIELPSGMFSSLSSLVTAKAATVTATKPSGDGSADSPFQIGKYSELVWFQQYVDKGNYSVNAILTADITANTNLISNGTYVAANAKYTWTPIVRDADSNYYRGTFDGNGHTISGLYVNDKKTEAAFIGQSNRSTIKNLYITDSYFGGYFMTATFVGYGPDSTIKNCGSDAVINDSTGSYCGGLAEEMQVG